MDSVDAWAGPSVVGIVVDSVANVDEAVLDSVEAVVASVDVSEACEEETVAESVDVSDISVVDVTVVGSLDGSAVTSVVTSLGATVDVDRLCATSA
jgi:hypothetical protein